MISLDAGGVRCAPPYPLRERARFHGRRVEAEQFRRQFMLELSSRPPLVVHDFGDELDMAQWCNAAWPCEKTARILSGVKAERRAMASPH